MLCLTMRIEAAELHLLELPLKFRFETSFGVQTTRHIPLLTLFGEGLAGYAEGVMEQLPLYREETTSGAVAFLLDTALDQVLGHNFPNPQAMVDTLSPFRGNRMAKAMIEMAFWDLWAKHLNQPLWTVLGGVRERIPVGVSLGIQPSPQATADLAAKEAAKGYKRIKLKIKPGHDVETVRAIRAGLPGFPLTVDANSAYALSDIRVFKEFDALELDYIEQPLAYDDLLDHAALQARIQTSICLDESVQSAKQARKGLQLGAGRVLNIKVARVGGHLEARKVHDVAQAFGAPVWMGGMLEAGVGRAHNIHAATLPGYSKPGDTSSASRYWRRDIINEALEAQDGFMSVPKGPGIGVTLDTEAVKQYTLKRIYKTADVQHR